MVAPMTARGVYWVVSTASLWHRVADAPWHENIAVWPDVLPSYSIETYGAVLGTRLLANFPGRCRYVVSEPDAEVLERLELPGLDLVPLDMRTVRHLDPDYVHPRAPKGTKPTAQPGWPLYLFLVRRELEAVDLANSFVHEPFTLTGAHGGHTSMDDEFTFFDVCCDEGLFCDPRFPVCGPYCGTEVAEVLNTRGPETLRAKLWWWPGKEVPPPVVVLPVPPDERDWREEADPDLRERLLRKIEEGGRIVGVTDPLGVPPREGARAIDTFVAAVKAEKRTLKASERDKIGAFFCDLVHREAGWPWVLVRNIQVSDPGWKPAVVDEARTLVVLSMMAFSSVKRLGTRDGTAFWTGLVYCASPRRWERRRPFGYEML